MVLLKVNLCGYGDLFSNLFHMVCEHFVKNFFCLYSSGNESVMSPFFVMSLLGFDVRVMLAS